MIHNPISESLALPKRLQGTDGVRGVACPADHPSVAGLTPVDAFLKKGILTEEFVELYCFCYVKLLEQESVWQPGQEIVIGWDPRDDQGIYHQAAIRGVCKAGAKAVAIGILPTPAVPLYLLHQEARGGIMITASHNPPDQNGIKLFSKTLGLKPLPADDQQLTSLIYQTPYWQAYQCPLEGSYEDGHDQALGVFLKFFEISSNTWLEKKDLLRHLILIIDPAYGCCRGLASKVFNQLGVKEVIEVNNDPRGQVNVNSGVAGLEGAREIDSQLQSDSGHIFQDYKVVQTMFEIGRKYHDSIIRGNIWVAGAVFDADGDRFYRLDYDPLRDRIIILSGDEIAYHQAKYLINRFPKELLGAPYVNTVESDLNSSLAAAELGYRPIIEAVGDKWLLVQGALNWLEARLDHDGKKHLGELKQKGVSAIAEIEDLFRSSKSKAQSSKSKDQTPALCRYEPESYPTGQRFRIIKGYSIGSETSGHTITPGLLNTNADITIPVFIGNALKSAVNTFVATESLYHRSDIARYIDQVHMPFPRGFQKSLPVYYTDKTRFYNGSPLWHQLEATIKEDRSGLWVKRVYPQERDMLYLAFNDHEGGQKGALFIRNSGTEDKTVVNLRGSRKDGDKLLAVGQTVLKLLFQDLKDQNHNYAQAETQILKTLTERGPCTPDDLLSLVPGINWDRLFNELSKQRLIEYRDGRVCLTSLGSWYIKKS